jgi:copper(I)-binding protein
MDQVARRLSVFLLAGMAAALSASAATVQLTASGAWSRPTPPGIRVGVVYLTLKNAGTAPDRLLRLSSPAAAKAQLHETRAEGGFMTMRELPFIDLPAGGELRAAPGALHIMLLGLKRPLAPGETFFLTMVFAHGGELTVKVSVREAP